MYWFLTFNMPNYAILTKRLEGVTSIIPEENWGHCIIGDIVYLSEIYQCGKNKDAASNSICVSSAHVCEGSEVVYTAASVNAAANSAAYAFFTV